MNHEDSIPISNFTSYNDIHQRMSEVGKLFLFMGEGKHKIKKKAEQTACDEAIQYFESFQTSNNE